MKKIGEFLKKNDWLVTIFIFGAAAASIYFYNKYHPSAPDPEPKKSWTAYYESKYFVNICDQLKKANRNTDLSDVEHIALAITEDVRLKYEVSELPFVNVDSLFEIAYDNKEVEIYYGEDSHTSVAYTESLVLNLDLTK